MLVNLPAKGSSELVLPRSLQGDSFQAAIEVTTGFSEIRFIEQVPDIQLEFDIRLVRRLEPVAHQQVDQGLAISPDQTFVGYVRRYGHRSQVTHSQAGHDPH